MSSSSGVPKIGTRIEPNSGSSVSWRSARSGIVTRRSNGFCWVLRYVTYRTSPASSHPRPTYRAPVCSTTTAISPAPASSAPATAGTGTRAPRQPNDTGISYPRIRAGSRKRSTMIERWAIVNDSSAPNAKMPTSSSRSVGTTSAALASAAAPITTHGVPQRPLRRPMALGIWRLVASE